MRVYAFDSGWQAGWVAADGVGVLPTWSCPNPQIPARPDVSVRLSQHGREAVRRWAAMCAADAIRLSIWR